MANFKELTTLKSVNKDWDSILRVIRDCKLAGANVMLHAEKSAWLKGELEKRGVEYLTLTGLITDQDTLKKIVFHDFRLDKVVISVAPVINAMAAKFKNRFVHIEVSHLRKSP